MGRVEPARSPRPLLLLTSCPPPAHSYSRASHLQRARTILISFFFENQNDLQSSAKCTSYPPQLTFLTNIRNGSFFGLAREHFYLVWLFSTQKLTCPWASLPVVVHCFTMCNVYGQMCLSWWWWWWVEVLARVSHRFVCVCLFVSFWLFVNWFVLIF